MTILSNITFFDLSMALLVIGCIDHLVCYLPESMVGPEGWLLKTDLPA